MPTQTARHVVLLLAICALTFFANLGASRLWDRDEPRNAGCTREMLQRGDWVVPVFNGELRTHKPVLLYWLMMTSYAALGDNEWGARFWSAALAAGSVLMTYAIGRQLFNSSAALWGGIVLASNLQFAMIGRAAGDAVLLLPHGGDARLRGGRGSAERRLRRRARARSLSLGRHPALLPDL